MPVNEHTHQVSFVIGGRSKPTRIRTLVTGPDGDEVWEFEFGDDVPVMRQGEVFVLALDPHQIPLRASWTAMTDDGAHYGEAVAERVEMPHDFLESGALFQIQESVPVGRIRLAFGLLMFTVFGTVQRAWLRLRLWWRWHGF